MRETSLVFYVEDGVLEPEVLREPLVDPLALAEEPRVGGGPQALLEKDGKCMELRGKLDILFSPLSSGVSYRTLLIPFLDKMTFLNISFFQKWAFLSV